MRSNSSSHHEELGEESIAEERATPLSLSCSSLGCGDLDVSLCSGGSFSAGGLSWRDCALAIRLLPADGTAGARFPSLEHRGTTDDAARRRKNTEPLCPGYVR